jgi:NAD(P)-dependent dehydrogenase (short-subunit alcohol dehydrogenase family)
MPVSSEFEIEGGAPPVALVTGGGRRIGAGFVRALAARGWRVAIHANRSGEDAEALAKAIESEGAPAPLSLVGDLSDPDVPAQLVARAGPDLRLLVNNASMFEEDGLMDFGPELWARHMDVNLRAPALLIQAFAKALPAGARGLVVNILDAKLAAMNPDFFSYTVSKVGLAGVTEMAARALAPAIRVNGISPAITLTWDPEGEARGDPASMARFARAHRLNPLGRGVSVADLATALLWLTETPIITGQVLTLDAGQRFLGLPRDVSHMVED